MLVNLACWHQRVMCRRVNSAGMQAYESLAVLEGTSSLAQQALQSGAKLKLLDTHNLNAYFNKVSHSA